VLLWRQRLSPVSTLVRAHDESGWTGEAHSADGRWSYLCEFDGDAGLGAAGTPGPGCWLGGCWGWYRGDAGSGRGAGWGDGPVGAAVGPWPAVALVGSYELYSLIRPCGLPVSMDNCPCVMPSGSKVVISAPRSQRLHASSTLGTRFPGLVGTACGVSVRRLT